MKAHTQTPTAAASRSDGHQRAGPASSLTDIATSAGTAAVVERLTALQKQADGSAPVQRVKNELVGADQLRGNMRFAILDEFGKEGLRADPQDILDVARQKYEANLDRGLRLMGELDALKAEEDDEFGRGSDEIAAAQDEKTAMSDLKHEMLYETRASPQETKGHYATSTRGVGAEKDAYTNNVYVPDRAIETNSNFAEKDPNRDRGDYLNNSEIFWHQWKAAVDADTQHGPFKDSRRKKKTKELGQITRAQIMNPDTLFTTHYALPNGMYFISGTTYQFGPDQEEFAALLGTPNGRGVAYLLKDHYHEMEKQSYGGVAVDGEATSLTFTFV